MYIGTSINDSPTIARIAGGAITSGAFLAAKFDGSGDILQAGAGENAIGLLPAETPEAIAEGDRVTVQVKEIGLWKAGAAIAAGAELTPDADGKAATAGAGDYVVAIALKAAATADEVIPVQIVKCGKVPPAALGDLGDVTITTATNGQALKYDGTSEAWINAADATE